MSLFAFGLSIGNILETGAIERKSLFAYRPCYTTTIANDATGKAPCGVCSVPELTGLGCRRYGSNCIFPMACLLPIAYCLLPIAYGL